MYIHHDMQCFHCHFMVHYIHTRQGVFGGWGFCPSSTSLIHFTELFHPIYRILQCCPSGTALHWHGVSTLDQFFLSPLLGGRGVFLNENGNKKHQTLDVLAYIPVLSCPVASSLIPFFQRYFYRNAYKGCVLRDRTYLSYVPLQRRGYSPLYTRHPTRTPLLVEQN